MISPTANGSPFNRLVVTSTLGRIACALSREKCPRDRLANASEFWIETWARYDLIFGERPDYRLWRVRMEARTSPPAPSQWSNPADLLRASLESTEKVVPWGGLSVLAYLLDYWRGKERQAEAQALLTDQVLERIRQLSCLHGGEKQCEVLRERILVEAERNPVQWGPNRDATRDCADALDTTEKWLQKLWPDWRREHVLYCTFNDKKVTPYHDVVIESFVTSIISLRLGVYLSRVKEIAASPPEIEQLLARAETLARTAWQHCRHKLRGQLLRGEKNAHVAMLERKNAIALRQLVFASSYVAATDIGRLRTAALAHLLLRASDADANQDFVQRFGWQIRQAGLQVDERFDDDLNANHIREARPPRHFDPFWRRIIHEQATHPEWKKLRDSYSVWKPLITDGELEEQPDAFDGVDTLRFLAHAAEDDKLTDVSVLRAGFQLAIRYGCTAWAAKFIRALRSTATRSDLLDFAHHLKRAQQVLPLGMDRKEQKDWQNRLRNAWHVITAAERLHGKEALVLHEVLLGRSLQLLRDATPNAAKLIALRYHDLLPDSALRAAVQGEPDATDRGPATVNPKRIAAFLESTANGNFGSPMSCSLVRIKGDLFHLLAVARQPDGRLSWYSDTRLFSGITEDAKALHGSCREWLVERSDGTLGLEVDWGDGFPEIVRCLAALARAWRVKPSWLMLAVETDLASVPWQHLVQRFWPGNSPVASLVPSIGWAALTYDQPNSYSNDYRLRLSTESDPGRASAALPDLQTLRFRVAHVAQDRPRIFNSTAVITGHGRTSDTGLPLIHADRGVMRADEWIEIGDYRVVMLHSCFGGHTSAGYLGDLGGVPGLTLGVRTRLLCAPVSEVPIETALTLHEKHVCVSEPREFGARYMAALRQDPVTALYNLYGFPGERLG